METVNLILVIIASIASIAAAVISLQNKQEIKSIKKSLSDNSQTATGKVATNVVGSNNSANIHASR